MTTAPEADKAGGFVVDPKRHPEYRVGKRTCGHPDCWCAWCRTCGTKITHCDFTARDALDVALSSDHVCGGAA